MLTIEAVSFDTSRFQLLGDGPGCRHWTTGAGDTLLVRVLPGASPLVSLVRRPDATSIYQAYAARDETGLVELTPLQFDGWVAVRVITKGAQDRKTGRGRWYVGELTIPFREGCILLRVESHEGGWTGVRESEVLVTLGAGIPFLPEASASPPHPGLPGIASSPTPSDWRDSWVTDPRDPAPRHLARCIADDPIYDPYFPDHPLSRLRAILDGLQHSIRVAPDASPAGSWESAARRKWWEHWRSLLPPY